MEIVSLNDARERGLTHYFTGKPCCRGHVSHRFVRGRSCAECLREKGRTEKHRKASLDSLDRKIIIALNLYGLVCTNCGEDRWEVLDFHHRNGREHHVNDDIKKAVTRICRAGRKLKEYQLLCANCHRIADISDNTGKRGRRMERLYADYLANKHGGKKK